MSHPDRNRSEVTTAAGETLLDVRNLSKHFSIKRGWFSPAAELRAVDTVSFDLKRGEVLGLVGESGCGKSTTSNLIMRLLSPTSGSIHFGGVDIATLRGRAGKSFSRHIQMVFQDPFSSLNPLLTAGQNVMEPLRVQKVGTVQQRRARAAELFNQVGLRPEHMDRKPGQFSGGQRQRIGIARALALQPELVILDEPVSALDVSVQAQVLNLLRRLQREIGLSYLFVSHDLSVVRHICDRIAVMYLGKIVEIGAREEIFRRPRHPYTHALMSAVPVPDPAARRKRVRLQGEAPGLDDLPKGCRFASRCPKAQSICREVEPALTQTGGATHSAACHFPMDDMNMEASG